LYGSRKKVILSVLNTNLEHEILLGGSFKTNKLKYFIIIINIIVMIQSSRSVKGIW